MEEAIGERRRCHHRGLLATELGEHDQGVDGAMAGRSAVVGRRGLAGDTGQGYWRLNAGASELLSRRGRDTRHDEEDCWQEAKRANHFTQPLLARNAGLAQKADLSA